RHHHGDAPRRIAVRDRRSRQRRQHERAGGEMQESSAAKMQRVPPCWFALFARYGVTCTRSPFGVKCAPSFLLRSARLASVSASSSRRQKNVSSTSLLRTRRKLQSVTAPRSWVNSTR